MNDEMDFDSFLAQDMWGLSLDDVCEACIANIDGSEYIDCFEEKLRKKRLEEGVNND